MACVPDQAPLAVQVVALVLDHLSVEAEPTWSRDGVAVKFTVGLRVRCANSGRDKRIETRMMNFVLDTMSAPDCVV